MNGLLQLFIDICIGGLFIYLIFWVLGYLGAPEPIRKIAVVIVVLFVVIWLAQNLNLSTGTHHRWLHW